MTTTRIGALKRPTATADYTTPSKQRSIGLTLAAVGLMLAMVTLIANVVAGNLVDSASDGATAAQIGAWSFGLTTLAFGTIKLGIGVILIGILVRLWLRVESVKAALPSLKGPGGDTITAGTITTPWGTATTSAKTPRTLPIHHMAKTTWAPMLAMGAMALLVGTIVSFVWAGNVGTETGQTASAWTQGLQFLGEGLLLGGVSFLLGSILASLRDGGGEVQEALGVKVETLKMPATAKAFVGFMMLGMMLAVLQFILYLVANGAETAQSFAAWGAWLGPLRELSLGSLLIGIVLALVTIGNVLGFQFDRLKTIVTTGN